MFCSPKSYAYKSIGISRNGQLYFHLCMRVILEFLKYLREKGNDL